MRDIINLDSVSQLLESNVNIISEFRAKYHFQGSIDYLHLFDALIIFYDRALFEKLGMKLSEFNRLKNAYFWYTKYISALRKQDFPVGDHEQAKFKIIEEMDGLAEITDWIFIKEIDEYT